jgi:hypothetical protein
MRMTIDLTDELINTRFAPVAALLAYYQANAVLKPLETVSIAMKTIDFAPANKLLQVFASLLTGCKYVSMVTTRLQSERVLAQVLSNERFAHQATLSETLNALTLMNLTQLDTAVAHICQRCSRTHRHDWRGFLWLDFDLSGMPCGQQAEGSRRGFFSGKKTPLDANWHASVPSTTTRPCGQICFPAIVLQWTAWNPLYWGSKLH